MSNFSSFSGYAGPVTAYGTSYMADPAIDATAQGHEMYRQVAQRGGIASVASYGVSASRLIEIAARMVGPVPTAGDNSYAASNAAGRILLIDGTTNDAQFSTGTGSTPTAEEAAAAQEALRTICAIAGTQERIEDTDGRWTYTTGTWSGANGQNYASGGTFHFCADTIAACSCTWTQPANVGYVYFLGIGAPAGSSGGYTAANISFSLDGGSATTKNFAGTINSFASTAAGNSGNNVSQGPVVFRVPVPVSSTPTSHTLVISKNGPSILTIDALLIPATTPPRVTLMKSPPVPTSYSGAAHLNAMLVTFNGYVDSVGSEFAFAHVVDWQGVVNGAYDSGAMIGGDHIHPNFAGETHAADQVVGDINAGLPVITSPATASGTVGGDFTYQITASNTPTSFSVAGLPSGVTFSPSTGLIFGVFVTAGVLTVTVQATNAGGTGSRSLTITIAPPQDAIAPTLTSLAISAEGNKLYLGFSEDVTGISLASYALSGGATLSNLLGAGSLWEATINPVVVQGQTPTLSYSGTGTVDLAGNPLAQFAGAAVANGSLVSTPTVPTPGFSVSPTSGPAPLAVAITNASTGATSYSYAWGDGSAASTTAAPTHTYAAAGTYTITQIVTNAQGSATVSHTVTVTAPAAGVPAPNQVLAGVVFVDSNGATQTGTLVQGSGGGIGGTTILSGGKLEIVRGFKLAAAEGRALVIALPFSPNPSSATPMLRVRSRPFLTPQEFSGMFITVDGAPFAQFEPTASQTENLDLTNRNAAGRYQVGMTYPNTDFILAVEGDIVIRD